MTPQQAYRKVRTALENGVLIRPKTCNRCGCEPGKASDGRSAIHAHHHDYSKPLDVEWICAKCHRKETPLPEMMGAPSFGESNWNHKLKEYEIIEIRSSKLGCKKLAKQYHVNKKTIQRIRRRQAWTHI